jgi:hypothetical protein
MIVIIARNIREADTYAYTNGISEYTHTSNANGLLGIARGTEYVWVPEYLYMISDYELRDISIMIKSRGMTNV